MAYAIMRISKIHALQSVAASERHGRFRDKLKNRSHPEREKENKIFFNEIYQNMRLADAVENRIKDCPVVRSNSVRCYEIVLTYSPEASEWIEPVYDDWIRDNVNWLASVFGSDNVICVRSDRDETTGHLHAYVTPVTSDGRLSAKDFTGGKVKMSELQDSYASEMKKYDLERGQCYLDDLEKPTRRHRKLKEFYKQKEKNIERI